MCPTRDRRTSFAAWMTAGALLLALLGARAAAASPFGHATYLVVPTARSWELRPLAPPPLPAPIPTPIWTPPSSPLLPGPVVRPTPRPSPRPAPAPPAIVAERMAFDTVIRDSAASTTMELVLRNRGGVRAEAVVLLPLPFDAAVTALELEGLGSEGVATLLPRDEARRIYDTIVNQILDPALVEFAGWNLIRSSVFPIEPGQSQKVRLTFDHLLEVDGDRIDLVLPRSETLPAEGAWSITVDASGERPLVDAYSPTHTLEVKRVDERRLTIAAATSRPVPGPFRLSLLRAPQAPGSPLAASVMLSPDPAGGGGQFMILAGVDPRLVPAAASEPRELVLTIDRSGSMAGEKMRQAREAALSLVDALRDGDFLNVIDFSNGVNALFDAPRAVDPTSRAAARAFIERMAPSGGTNIHDALVEALSQRPSPAALRTVLFLTDGLPTVGRTVEAEVRSAVEKGNPHGRRVHALGVGLDVNAPLLDRIGDLTRGSTSYVAPGDSIGAVVSRIGRLLDGPVLLAPTLVASDRGAIADVLPMALPDLHSGEQMVILGRYHGSAPIGVRLEGERVAAGTVGPRRVSAEVVIDPAKATVRHAFVGRLWATRQIALLADAVRQLTAPGSPALASPGDPRLRELTEQIVALSLRWGVLTEYTSFLAAEGGGLDGAPVAGALPAARQWSSALETCDAALQSLAMQSRSGAAGVAQGMNYNERKGQSIVNLDNRQWDSGLNHVSLGGVCQVADRGFFRKGDAWIDGNIVASQRDVSSLVPDRTVTVGSPEYNELVATLSRTNRQAVLALPGNIYLVVDGAVVLIQDGC